MPKVLRVLKELHIQDLQHQQVQRELKEPQELKERLDPKVHREDPKVLKEPQVQQELKDLKVIQVLLREL